jgi:uncharacterized protein
MNMKIKKNNLSAAVSPYLRQHSDNPVWWQELTEEILEYSKEYDKPLLLSSGYSTCHWCHVMANEAFSDKETAEYLNQHFISIKIDREMQPDIDSWMMSYLQNETGQGGWPLNVFADGRLKPFYAMMYAPADSGKFGRPSLLEILKHIKNYYDKNKHRLESWSSAKISSGVSTSANYDDEDDRIRGMFGYFDTINGGMQGRQKFPPHSLLHYLLTVNHNVENADKYVQLSLDKMYYSGLHDSLQGGFYRYCVDQNWEIPHFEKMLYDQAMMLMNYSLAYKKYKKDIYKKAVIEIITCLDESFEIEGLYASAHDADTNHHEGLTYIWTIEELKSCLNDKEFKIFTDHYNLAEFEGKYHLIKESDNAELQSIEKHLLKYRLNRSQPFRDDKVLTSWNALTGIALLFAARYAEQDTYQKALTVFENLINKHRLPDNRFSHSSYGDLLQNESYLQDIASLMLFATYLYEDRLLEIQKIEELNEILSRFKQNGIWYESFGGLLGKVNADIHDHPVPSSVSMANAAISRYKLMIGEIPTKLYYQSPLVYDYFNLAVKWSQVKFPLVKSPKKIDYKILAPGVIQIKGKELIVCYNNSCSIVTESELIDLFQNL